MGKMPNFMRKLYIYAERPVRYLNSGKLPQSQEDEVDIFRSFS